MEHVPTATSVTVLPEIVQTGVVVELKATARPDDAVALTVKVPDPAIMLFPVVFKSQS